MHEEEEEAARERRARSHSARIMILGLLAKGERKLSAEQIRAELSGDVTLRSLYYHLRVLETTNLIDEEGGSYKLAA
jgi:Fe2+ or Zn2+ uptake regulation protein